MSLLRTEHFIRARTEMGRRHAERRAERFGRTVGGADYDDASMLVEVDDPPAPPIAFHFVYEDAAKNLTGRVFVLRKLGNKGNDIAAGGICQLRRAYRTLLCSRVVEGIDLATGEVFEDGLEYFRAHPLLPDVGQTALASASANARALRECRDEIIILSFLAASDDDFCEAEEDAIVRHVFDRFGGPGLDEARIRQGVRSFVPDEVAFDRALGRMCDGEGDPVALMRAMRRVIDADGELDEEEVAFASEVQSRLMQAKRL